MPVKDLKEFLFENCYKRISIIKEDSKYFLKEKRKKDLVLLATNVIKKY